MIFSIAMGADYTFYVKSIETHVRAFLPLNISAVSSVHRIVNGKIKQTYHIDDWQLAVN